MERWRLEAMQRATALLADFIEGLPEPGPTRLEPVACEEVPSPGKYEGMIATTARCPKCHVLVTHLTEPGDAGDALTRGSHCQCRGTTYVLPLVLTDSLFGTGGPMFAASPDGTPFGFQTGRELR